MKTNEYRGDSEASVLPYSAPEAAEPADADRATSNRILARGDAPRGPVAAMSGRGRLPLRTLIVCFTIWLIATQAMIFDQVKFDERAHLLEQATRSLGGPQVVVPNEPPSNSPTGGMVQRL
jgi:hypothetical protein